MKLEEVALKAGKIEKYVSPREEMEKVDLKNIPDVRFLKFLIFTKIFTCICSYL